MGCPTVGNTWLAVGKLCFQFLDLTESTQLGLNPQLTVLYLNENLPMHQQGTLSSLDIMIDCSPEFSDADADGLNQQDEVALGTDPNNPDSDEDGLTDRDEINIYNTNPTASDSDGDDLPDGAEVFIYNSDPAIADTDGDDVLDGE